MGEVHTEITIKNVRDQALFEEGYLTEQKVHTATVTAVVDTGATYLVIGEKLREQLGLKIIRPKTVNLAGGKKEKGGMTEPVYIYWKNRMHVGHAQVLPNQNEPLLGVLPLEDMDLIVDPKKQELIGKHGDEEIANAVGVFSN